MVVINHPSQRPASVSSYRSKRYQYLPLSMDAKWLARFQKVFAGVNSSSAQADDRSR